MSNFPNSIDDDVSLPIVNDNLTEIGADAINSLREAVFNIETEIGIGASGTAGSLASRLGIGINPDGTIKPSAIASLGLVTLPITNDQIADNAQIPESKLKLDHRTQDLYNYTLDLSRSVNTSIGWISTTGVKLEPHLFGSMYQHTLPQVLVDTDSANYLKNKFNLLRDNSNAYLAINDLNTEFLNHQFADGLGTSTDLVITKNGESYPSNYGHTASGIFLNTNRFTNIPQTAEDLQSFANFIDESSTFLYGTRIQNLYSNGVSRLSRSSSLINDGYGTEIIGETSAVAYLLNDGTSSLPFDDVDRGDDIIEFKPSSDQLTSNSFDAKFALVKAGDILRINYGSIQTSFVIKEKKFVFGSGKRFVVRINGKNLFYQTDASARIDSPLVNDNKFGVLAAAAANNSFSTIPSLIIGQPRSAQALGIGFNPKQFDEDHYLLYLAIYPTGNPLDGYSILPAIDMTGDLGASPGKYTLESIIETTNNAFRRSGYNYRFIAFNHGGEFGVMLADSYNNCGFSILSGLVDSNGFYDQAATQTAFPKNIVDLFSSSGKSANDPCGFGPSAANIASPPFNATYPSTEAALTPLKLFLPLKRNNFYVNGTEREKLTIEDNQILDNYGDGYWSAEITDKQIFPGVNGRVETTYGVNFDLSTTNIKPGKTIVVQSYNSLNNQIVNFGRFLIKSVNFDCANASSEIVVYDSVHGVGESPSTNFDIGQKVSLYFNSDSVSFNDEASTDSVVLGRVFKRHFEVYVDENSKTFSHERARFNITASDINVDGTVPLRTYSELNKVDIIDVSPKLKGYLFGKISKVTLLINSFDESSGIYDGYLCSYDGTNATHLGPLTSGIKGEVTRFYDESNIDYIDLKFDLYSSISSFTSKFLDIQLFSSLSLNQQSMILCSCQLNDIANTIKHIVDKRQFGNTSEKDLTTSALNYISLPDKLLHANGVIRGFDVIDNSPYSNPFDNQLYLDGGIALVGGKLIEMNPSTVTIPIVKEYIAPSFYNINWLICINDKSEYELLVLLDYDTNLNTPTDSTRIVNVYNPKNGLYYNLPSITFSDLINKRKDLTLLYIGLATVNELTSETSLDYVDAKKYVNDADSNLPLRLTSSISQGNFRNPKSIFTWIKYNNSFNGVASLKGATVSDGIITEDINLDFDNSVVIDGENDATITFNGFVNIGSNITFKNITLRFNGGLEVISGASNVTFDNCSIQYTAPVSPAPVNNIVFNFVGSTKVNFTNCSISATYSTLASGGAVIQLSTSTKFTFKNNSLSAAFLISAGAYTPGDGIKMLTCSNVNISDSTISGNFANAISMFTGTSNVNIDNVTIAPTYNPSLGPDFSYSTSNLVNSNHGMIYGSVTNAIRDISINNIDVQYSSQQRFPHISFEFYANNGILENLTIQNCRFVYLNGSTTVNDYRCGIAIVNALGSTLPSYSQQPIARNVKILNNFMNRNQSIIFTSKTVSNKMVYAGLVAESCVISNNTCGTIGYWISAGSKTVSMSPNVNSFTDKISGLIISDNICHYIYNCDHAGKYFLVSSEQSGATANNCSYASGSVIISGNKTNWIHVGIAYEENSSLHITKNYLTAYDGNYLSTYDDGVGTFISDFYGTYGSYGYAIFVSANKHVVPSASFPGQGSDSACIISDNIVNSGYWLQTSLVALMYEYVAGYIMVQPSATITNNILKGVGDTVVAGNPVGVGIMLGGVNSIVTNNKIYRRLNDIDKYVAFYNRDLPAWNGVGSYGIVKNNFFDNTINDSISLSENLIQVPAVASSSWIYECNINQTKNISIPISNSQLVLFGALGILQAGIYSTDFYMKVANTSLGLYRSNVMHLHDSHTPITPRYIGWQENLDKYLPQNVKIIGLSLGLRSFDLVESNDGTFPTRVNLYLNRYAIATAYTNLDYFSSATDNDTRVTNAADPPRVTLTGSAINLGAGDTVEMEIDTTVGTGMTTPSNVSHTYTTGNGYSFGVTLDFQVQRLATMDILLSPLLVKYRW